MLRPSPRDGIWFIVIRFEYAIHGLCRDSSKGAQVGRSDEERYEERGQNVVNGSVSLVNFVISS